jgi:serine/threonine-protein kinase
MARKKVAPSVPLTCPGCGRAADPAAGPLNFCPECGADLRGAGAGGEAAGGFLDKVIADRYRLLALLGQGGMGAVYKAEHVRMGKALALKILRGDFAREEGAVERFRAEARIVSRLSHPHTIAVFDFGEIEDGSGFYLAMEYVPGKDLAAVLREAKRLPEGRAVEIGQQILGSLAEAHDAGIVHRDVKPGNVMLMQTRAGEDWVKVLDFGIAKLRDEGAAGAASTTSAGAIVGTPNYLAPEQARGEVIDGRADLYAVGCLLYELVAGRPPFQAPSPMAVVSAHLHQEPPRLGDQAPDVSRPFADVVHRALAKKPEERFASADAMRDALLALGAAGGARHPRRPASPNVTGELEIARREDFREFERHLRALRRSRVLAPVTALVLAAAVAGAAWRWTDLYAFLALRSPALAAALPEGLRPSGHYDGTEHEPNDVPGRANPLPLPPGPDGRPGGGVAVIRGHVGAKLSAETGDVDIFRIELPPAPGRKVLVASWRGEREGEGIRGLDVALALNRERAGDDARTSAPLVSSVNRGGPGRPEALVAAVEAGAYYLAVREQHDPVTGPVEKPTDAYLLEVRLADPEPGEEVEPNDAPDRVDARFQRYPEWRAVAERNPLAEGAVVHGETAPDDPDVYAVEARDGEAPALLAAVPAAGLALSARTWAPDAEDLGAARPQDRVRFERAADAAPGAVLFVRVPPAGGRAPALVELRAAEGEGRYDLVALGAGRASGEAALGLLRALAAADRPAPALEVAAGYATRAPRAAGRDDVLLAAGRVAEAVAARLGPEAARAHDRAAQLLGTPLFVPAGDGRVAYGGAFEAQVQTAGRPAEEAALRLVGLASPCTPDDVAARAAAFLGRRPEPAADLAEEARVVRARALEDGFWSTGGKDRARLDAALAAWRALAASGRAGGPEATLRAAALEAREPSREGARPVCR